jgi:hypothetical protein
MAADEKFCSSCGAAVAAEAGGAAEASVAAEPGVVAVVQDLPPASPTKAASLAAFGKARKWLLAVAIITLLSGLLFYAINKQEVEKEIDQVTRQVRGIDPAELDRRFQQNIGMTFQDAIDHDRGMVNLLLAVNLALSAGYLVLWAWAKRKPLPAAIIALIMFVTTVVISAVYDPSSIHQGIIVKIFFTLALVRAITAANQERMAGAPA